MVFSPAAVISLLTFALAIIYSVPIGLDMRPMFPEKISAIDTQLVQVAHLSPPIDPAFPDKLRSQGYIVHVEHEFEWPGMPANVRTSTPILSGTIYEQHDNVQLPWYTVNPHLQMELTRGNVQLETTKATDAMFLFQGGQKGRGIGGIYVYPKYGPLVVSTSIENAHDNLRKVAEVYCKMKEARGNRGQLIYTEGLFEQAVNEAMGIRITERKRVPVGTISLLRCDNYFSPVARYFSDSQTIVSMAGNPLPFIRGDGKTQTAVVWPNL